MEENQNSNSPKDQVDSTTPRSSPKDGRRRLDAHGDELAAWLARRSRHQSLAPQPRQRAALRKAREQMLERVETYTSAQLAAGCNSLNVNPSQFAADMRKANRIFAVRFGRDWRYPRFQFNHGSKPLEPFPEMRDVLTALAPDKRGWDRLQWFLEPNSVLNGRIPLEVWREDSSNVVAAARTEHWDARD